MSSRSLCCSISLLGLAAMAVPMAFADDYRISGPYTHDNLSIFLIHGAAKTAKPAGKYITLQEAMEQKKVVVYETGSVNELAIENLGDKDIYIQSGDIVKGGRQDRVFPDDFVLQTRSGKVPINSFCVEHGRWTKRGGEASDHFNASNQALPNKALKLAARSTSQGQTKVWSEVEKSNRKVAASAGYASGAPPSPSPTSMQMALEDKHVSEKTDAYIRDLAGVVEGKTDVVGYAFAINGALNSADVYASNDMFVRMWPKLLRASAVEALTERQESRTFTPPSTSVVRSVIAKAEDGKESKKKDVADRLDEVTKESDKVVMFETRDRKADGTWIHKSIVVK
jgi:hypothetical protein